jgi:hypothetical protein
MAYFSPGTMADDLERLLGGDRRPHHLLDVSGISYLPDIHAYRPAFPPQPLLFVATPSIGIDAGHKGTVADDLGFGAARPRGSVMSAILAGSICFNTSTAVEVISSILRSTSNYCRHVRM